MTDKEPVTEGMLRLRLGLHDTHYADGLIPAATIMRLFADCQSEVSIRMDGVDGYMAAYEKSEFLKPIYAGDYLEIRAKLISQGNRSRRFAMEALRCLATKELGGGLSGGTIFDPPELVARATLVCVKPRT